MKKTRIIAGLLLLLLLPALASCGLIERVETAVKYPDAYSISYERKTADGRILTVTKTVDEDGNLYYKDEQRELLFLADGAAYTLYERNADGAFVAAGDVKYTREAAEKETEGFDALAKKTTDRFIPTAKKTGETTVAGRTADTYRLGVNLLAVSFYHIYSVDRESGVCLGVAVVNTVFGTETEGKEDTFTCVCFETEDIENLVSKIS